MDIYSELESPALEGLNSALPGARYCGTIAPHVRISLYNVMIIVFHSRVGRSRAEKFILNGFTYFILNPYILTLKPLGEYEFISEAPFVPGSRLKGIRKCAFLVEPGSGHRSGVILSPTYPGAYPSVSRDF